MYQTNDSNQLFPIFLKLNQINTLLVGGGYVALEKVSALLKNDPNARVTIVAPEVSREIRTIAAGYRNIKLKQESYNPSHLKNKQLVIAATNDYQLNGIIHLQAKERGILSNVADTPEHCDFYLGSTVKKGNLKIGISTNGKSPTFAKRLREILEKSLPDATDQTLTNLNKIRNSLNSDISKKIEYLNSITASMVNEN